MIIDFKDLPEQEAPRTEEKKPTGMGGIDIDLSGLPDQQGDAVNQALLNTVTPREGETAPAAEAPGYEPGKQVDRVSAYYNYLQNGIDLTNRPGPAQRMAQEEKKVRGETESQRGVLVEQIGKYDIQPKNQATLVDRITDVPIVGFKAAVALPESFVGLADLFSLGYAGKGVEKAGVRFRDAQQDLEYFLSPQQQEINRTIGQVQDFGERLKYGIVNPSYILQQIAISIPSILSGNAIGRGVAKLAVKSIPALAPYIKMGEQTLKEVSVATGGGVGEGAVTAGQMAEQVRQGTPEGTLTLKQSGVIALAGTVTGLISTLGGMACQKLGIADVDILFVGGGLRAGTQQELTAKRTVLLKVAASMLEEGTIEEMPQSAQEQYWQNVAEGKPPMQGVAAAAADGWLSGTGMGGMGGAYKARSDYRSIERAKAVDAVQQYVQRAQEAASAAEPAPVQMPVVETAPDGRTVATREGAEIGSYENGNLTISDDYTGDRILLAKTLLQNVNEAMGQRGSVDFTPVEDKSLPKKGVVYSTATNQAKLQTDPDWVSGKKEGDMEAARRFAERNWNEAKTEEVLKLVGDPGKVLFIALPSTFGNNVHPLALAERLANETKGQFLSGRDYADVAHEEESKTIKPSERVLQPRRYRPIDLDTLRAKVEGKEVVVVDDIYTSGGSASGYIRFLQNNGIPVKAHVGYFGDARLRPDGQTISALQSALKNAQMPIKGRQLAEVLTRREVRGIIQTINQARSEDARQELTRNLQGILDRGAAGSAQESTGNRLSEGRTRTEAAGDERLTEGASSDTGSSALTEVNQDSQSLTDKVKAINDSMGEKGSVDLTPVIELGWSLYESGANTLESFTARAKELFADVWDKVKDLVRQAWDVISNESGKVTVKGPKQETLESWVRKKRINFNIPGYSNKEAIENGLFGFVKNDAVPLDKFAEEAQSMGLLGATPDEYATAGDYLYDELKRIVANRAKNKTTSLLSEKERDIMDLREDLRRDGYNEREIKEIVEQAERDSQEDFGSQEPDEQVRIARDLLEEDGFVSEDESENASEQTSQETVPEPNGSVQSSSEMEVATAYNKAEAQTAASAQLTTQSYEEFEKVILGNANWGDTFNENPLRQRMSKEDWKELERRGILSARVEQLQVEKKALKEMIDQARSLANDYFRAGQKIGAIEQLQKVRELQEQRKIRLAMEREMAATLKWLDRIQAAVYKRDIKLEPEHRKAVESALAGNADAVEKFILQGLQTGDIFMIPQEQLDILSEMKFNEPTFEELRVQRSIVKQLIYQGRKARSIEIATKNMELVMAIDDMVQEVRDANQVPELTRKEVLRAESYKDISLEQKRFRAKAGEILQGFMSILRKGEYIIKNLAGYDTSTTWYQGTFQKMADAEGVKIWLDLETGKLAKKAFDLVREEYQSGQWDEDVLVTAPDGTQEEFTRRFMVGVALNSGCKDNVRAMMDGNDLSEAMIQEVNKQLTIEERAFVQAVWDIFRWQLPHLQKAYRSLMGDDMVLVDGVYYPMFFDKDLSVRLADAMANQDLFQTFGTAISVNKGRTMTRRGGREPLDFDPLRCLEAVNSTNQFVAYAEAVRDVNRVLSNQRIRSAVKDAMGEPYHRALKDWLRRIANPMEEYRGALPGIDQVVGILRDRAQVAILGWALSTAVMQPMAITMTVNRLGVAPTMKGFLDFYSDWAVNAKFCLDSSPWLATRIDSTGDITLSEMMAKDKDNVWREQGAVGERMKESFFGLIKLADSLVTMPTWYTAYQTEFERSADHETAVRYADEITRNSQGSSSAKDIATIQAGSNTRKIFVMFYSFFSAQFNEMVRTVDLVKHGQIGYFDLMRSYMWMILVPSILQAIVKARAWDDEKDKGKEAIKDIAKETVGFAASSIPVVGSIVNSLVGGYDFRPTPVSGATDVATRSIKSMRSRKSMFGSKNGEMPAWMRDTGMLIGYLARLPSRQMMRLADEAWKAYHKGLTWKNFYGLVYKEEPKKKK